MSLKSFAINDYRYLRLYKVVSGKLEEIDFEKELDTIKFVANTNDQIIILEELNHVDKNMAWVVIIIAFASAALISTIVLLVNNIRLKKKKA